MRGMSGGNYHSFTAIRICSLSRACGDYVMMRICVYVKGRGGKGLPKHSLLGFAVKSLQFTHRQFSDS